MKGTYRAMTGRSLNTLWGLQAERLFTEDDFDANGNLKFGIPTQDVGSATVRPGDIKYKDMNGDGVITDADEGYIGGTVDPRIVYGFGGNVSYKNWDLNFFFQGVGDTWRVIGRRILAPSFRDIQSEQLSCFYVVEEEHELLALEDLGNRLYLAQGNHRQDLLERHPYLLERKQLVLLLAV